MSWPAVHGTAVGNFAMYELCDRAIDGGHCGLYMPGTFIKVHERSWKFYCQIHWPAVCVSDPGAVSLMHEMHGTDKDCWPNLGCGARIVPWKQPLKVLEIRMNDGSWQALRAVRVPERLDYLIQKNMFEWHRAADKVTLEEIQSVVPLRSQAVHRLTVPGASWFDVQEWINNGKPTLSADGWTEICKIIAQKGDGSALAPIYDLCCQMLAGRGNRGSQNKIPSVR